MRLSLSYLTATADVGGEVDSGAAVFLDSDTILEEISQYCMDENELRKRIENQGGLWIGSSRHSCQDGQRTLYGQPALEA